MRLIFLLFLFVHLPNSCFGGKRRSMERLRQPDASEENSGKFFWEVFKVNSEPANINQEVLTNDDLTKCRDGQHDLFNTKFPTQDEKKTVLKILGEIINGNVASPGQLTLSEFRKCQLRTKYNNVRQAARRMSVGTSVGKPRGRYAKKHRTNP
ncbi:uncharacterized protein LOC120350367 isoform X2 [Nilaparvata lugens]|uniref:uncharacterized protein LOC120350367 isoform X2 n=1 Tax=Nilaparvata lugens TaxID=108931 RepID=UPI00193CAF8B|nr:uncharacterized protein LOC120350367 isoform X2 [Nilaparvata lugens]